MSKKEKSGWSFDKKQKGIAKSHKKAKQSSIPNTPVSAEKPEKESPEKTRGNWPRPLKIVLKTFAFLLLTISFVLLTAASGVFAYTQQYKNKALYGAKILGEDIGGKNLLEVQQMVENKVAQVVFSFSVDGETVNVAPIEAGVEFNPDGTAVAALRYGKAGSWYGPYLSGANSLLYHFAPTFAKKVNTANEDNIAVVYSIDPVTLSEMTQKLSKSYNVQSRNAGLVMRGTEVQVIPAIYGRKIITDSVKAQIAEAVKESQSAQIDIMVEKIEPKIADADTQATIAETKQILDTPVTLTYKGKSYTPDKATIGNWITFRTEQRNGQDKLVPVVNAGLAADYVTVISKNINIPAVNKKVTIKNGGAQTVDREGVPGLAVDVPEASGAIASGLNARRQVSLALPTYVVKPKTLVNNVIVADWSKYITVSLGSQKMCAWLAGGIPAFGEGASCWSVTTAATALGYHTPVGTHTIWKKTYVTSMPNPPSPYPLTNIHYVSYFTKQYHAIHEAWWRSSFGGNPAYNGSHGCVNAPYWLAQKIYNWAPIGTPVIVQ